MPQQANTPFSCHAIRALVKVSMIDIYTEEASWLSIEHWSHTKEHMLVGLKSNVNASGEIIWPSWINRGLDTDVIVSEVRETSRKPDEAYGLIERMCPGGRKVEIFGRKHNARAGSTLSTVVATSNSIFFQMAHTRQPTRDRPGLRRSIGRTYSCKVCSRITPSLIIVLIVKTHRYPERELGKWLTYTDYPSD